MHKLTPRFFIMPAGALALIAALAQAHGGSNIPASGVSAPAIQRAATCATAVVPSHCALAHADSGGTAIR